MSNHKLAFSKVHQEKVSDLREKKKSQVNNSEK